VFVCVSVNAHIDTHTHTHTFKVWYPWCASRTHNKRQYNPSTYNFTVASRNCNCMFQLHKVAIIRVYISKYKKEIIYLYFKYSYKWLVDKISALHIKVYMTPTHTCVIVVTIIYTFTCKAKNLSTNHS